LKIFLNPLGEDLDGITSVYNLKIQGNSVLFDSAGYGCYGVESENQMRSTLFEKIFDGFAGALVCFEYVQPCQSQDYYFSSTWAKPEGVVDWEDSTTYFQYSSGLLEEGDLCEDADEGDFDIAFVWYIGLDRLEKIKEFTPNLYAACSAAKEDGFENWDECPSSKPVISYTIACELAESYSARCDDIIDELHTDMREWVKADNRLSSLEDFSLPGDFPLLQTTYLF
jgi:hypothetical protein